MTRHNNIWQHKERYYGIWAECVILCYKIWYGVVRHNLISYFLHKKKVICDMTLYDMSSLQPTERDIKYYDTILQFGRKCGMTVYGKVLARYRRLWLNAFCIKWLDTTEFHSLWPDMVWYDRVWAKKVEYDLLLYTLSWKNSLWQYIAVSEHMTEAGKVWHAFTLIGRVRNEMMEYFNICCTWEWYDSMARYVTGYFTAVPLIRHGTVGVAEPTIVRTCVKF